MEIYQRKADLLIALHKAFHKLVLTEYDNIEDCNLDLWKKKLDENLQVNISFRHFNSPWSANKYIFRPFYKVHESQEFGTFYIEYKSYSGKVSKNIYHNTKNYISDIKRKYNDDNHLIQQELNKLLMPNGRFWVSRQSIFDFYLHTGKRYSNLYKGYATHFNLFEDLKRYSTYLNCLSIWRGDNIFNDLKCGHEKEALLTLSWLMFEQEINYGKPFFQQNTNFIMDNTKGLNYRSRDMLMGFINMFYSDTTLYETYPYWNQSSSGINLYPHFGNRNNVGFINLDKKYKKYFLEFNNDQKYKDVYPFMKVNGYLGKFIKLVNESNQNPYFNNLTL
ncbi:hypothetical protein [Peribacillus frigoritolerans]|uniref:hypothetical protein n=1 Tax=Peribacillus frigoritolerans TaxID=450367 RepID=UPI002E1BFED7|nr:hypothetical protein [Peribacillus frigoritolerans]